jgi:cytochrome c-type biogenesis protein CcmH
MNKVMSITLLIILLAIPLINQDKDTRYENWSKNILCPVCQGENISDSPSEYADDMRMILKEQIESGLSDEQIYNYWVVRYGERIITNPQRTNIEMIVLPILLIALFILIFIRSAKDE